MPHTPLPDEESVERRRSAAWEAFDRLKEITGSIVGSLTPSGQAKIRSNITSWLKDQWFHAVEHTQQTLMRELSFLNATDVQGLYIQYHEDSDLVFQWKIEGVRDLFAVGNTALIELARRGSGRVITVKQAALCFQQAFASMQRDAEDIALQLHSLGFENVRFGGTTFFPLGEMVKTNYESFIDCIGQRMLKKGQPRQRVTVVTEDGGVLPDHRISNRWVS